MCVCVCVCVCVQNTTRTHIVAWGGNEWIKLFKKVNY